METLPQCDLFFLFSFLLWIVTTEIKGERKRPQRRWKYICGNGAAKNLITSLKMGYFKELLLPSHSLSPFPKHDKQWKSLVMGGMDLFLFLPPRAPNLPPTLFLDYLTQVSPIPPACIGQSLTAVTREEFRPACRYCSSFQISMVSCCRCPYVLPSCITRKKDFVLVQLPFFYVIL